MLGRLGVSCRQGHLCIYIYVYTSFLKQITQQIEKMSWTKYAHDFISQILAC